MPGNLGSVLSPDMPEAHHGRPRQAGWHPGRKLRAAEPRAAGHACGPRHAACLLGRAGYPRICTRLAACLALGRRIVRTPSFIRASALSVLMSLGSMVR